MRSSFLSFVFVVSVCLGACSSETTAEQQQGGTLAMPGLELPEHAHRFREEAFGVSMLHEMDAGQVRLLPGSPFYERQALHRKGYVASFEPNRLLFHYRALAKLPQPEGVTGGYGGWDSGFIRGHMAGHFLSTASRMAAATGDVSFKEKADTMVAELAKCQISLNQGGYLAAFPSGAFDRLEGKRGNSGGVVVPYYTVHKIMAGLLDVHHYLGNAQALYVAQKMAGYFEDRLASLKPEAIETMFRTDGSGNPQNEFGAMSDVLAELYSITGERKHLDAAQLFNRAWFVGPLAAGEDRLAGLHANTHVAQAVGIAHCGNLSGDPSELKASENFWELVTRQHVFAIGGNSFKEWFDKPGVETGPSIDNHKALPATTAESCNTHNMLKLTTRLFEREPRAEYADYFERALYNHLLATVAPDTGAVTYFTPLYGHFRTYLNGTHCCVGSGIENTPRYNEGIYFQRDSSLWINLYIPSELNWQDVGLLLHQEGDVTKGERARFTIVKSEGELATLNFRVPHWISGPAVLTLNGKVEKRVNKPSTYVALTRTWKMGDVVTLALHAALRLEHAKDSSDLVSVFFGPVLLAGELGRENMPNDRADKDAYLKMPPVTVPEILSASRNPDDWFEPVTGMPLVFKARVVGPANGILFQPLYELHHQRYSVYWHCPMAEFEGQRPMGP
ncbi:MAG: glycoside hydrolase family 127 protein [Phycisphaeraceae bacterium]|nr:glycoside hydrolase family 127 protein [Phycisphaeraceae bacterium]